MESRFGTRYIMRGAVQELPLGCLYEADDLALSRRVLIYELNRDGTNAADSRASLLRGAAFSHEAFMHILDVGMEQATNFAVFKACHGAPLLQRLRRHQLTVDEVIQHVYELGQAMLEASEDGFYGYSVLTGNLWIGSGNRLMPIHYWESAEEGAKGAVGLCGLLAQLLAKDETAAAWSQAVEQHLRLSLYGLPQDRSNALLSLIERVHHEKLALSSFLVQLRACLPPAHMNQAVQPPVTASPPAAKQVQQSAAEQFLEDEDGSYDLETEEQFDDAEPRKPLWRRLAIIAGAACLFVIVFIGGLTLFFQTGGERSSTAAAPKQEEQSKSASAPDANGASTQNGPASKGNAAVKESPGQAVNASAQGPTTIPKLIGLTRAEAEKQALAAGLHYSFTMEPSDSPQGTVYQQNPAPGTAAVQGDNVQFNVSKGKS